MEHTNKKNNLDLEAAYKCLRKDIKDIKDVSGAVECLESIEFILDQDANIGHVDLVLMQQKGNAISNKVKKNSEWGIRNENAKTKVNGTILKEKAKRKKEKEKVQNNIKTLLNMEINNLDKFNEFINFFSKNLKDNIENILYKDLELIHKKFNECKQYCNKEANVNVLQQIIEQKIKEKQEQELAKAEKTKETTKGTQGKEETTKGTGQEEETTKGTGTQGEEQTGTQVKTSNSKKIFLFFVFCIICIIMLYLYFDEIYIKVISLIE
jgi:hypothetical protein